MVGSLSALTGEKTIVKNTPAGKTETIEITVPLSDLTNLAILNLHCNKFSEMKTLAPLAKLTRLEKLTLHGNPMEEVNARWPNAFLGHLH